LGFDSGIRETKTKIKDQITPDRIANSIRLLCQDHEGVFLIVEGYSDRLIYERVK